MYRTHTRDMTHVQDHSTYQATLMKETHIRGTHIRDMTHVSRHSLLSTHRKCSICGAREPDVARAKNAAGIHSIYSSAAGSIQKMQQVFIVYIDITHTQEHRADEKKRKCSRYSQYIVLCRDMTHVQEYRAYQATHIYIRDMTHVQDRGTYQRV